MRYKLRIDFASARREFYDKPAVLPTVEFSRLKEDLFRRDFTINSMAISINKEDFGRLISFFGAKEDLRNGIIRVLHNRSFIDDPTRIFRAVRFEQRFGFRIEDNTSRLIKDAVDLRMFEKTHPHRIINEITAILKERAPLKAVKRMDQLHELKFIHPDVKLTSRTIRLFRSIDKASKIFLSKTGGDRKPDLWLLYFMALIDDLSGKKAQNLMEKFGMSAEERSKVLLHKSRSADIIKLLSAGRDVKPSRIYRTLKGLSLENILMLIASTDRKPVKKNIFLFLDKYKNISLRISGLDLQKKRYKPGPEFGRVLDMTLDAKLDGKLRTKADELAFAERAYRSSLR